jgi:hypothetical protein
MAPGYELRFAWAFTGFSRGDRATQPPSWSGVIRRERSRDGTGPHLEATAETVAAIADFTADLP